MAASSLGMLRCAKVVGTARVLSGDACEMRRPVAECSATHQRARRRPSASALVVPGFAGLRSSAAGVVGRPCEDLNGKLHQTVQTAVHASARSGGSRKGPVTMMPIGTPRVPYRTPGEGGWQWVDIWNVLYRERILFVGQAIDEEFGNQIIATMLYLDSLDDKPQVLYINSPGGEISPALAIYDTMTSLKSQVGTVAFGHAWSIAAFLLAAGTKGRRSALPRARIMLHQPSGAARGKASDIQNEAQELIRTKQYLFNVLAEKTGKPYEVVEKDLSRVKYLNVEEAQEYGIIDRVIRPRRQRLMPDQ
ncbi:ATP-dependent Clp protease proteolytic subunit [Klebsormidium nitens]|uniref:ATP-dependent Clp protease proteolytic subunit n=1 Tax=Klebsormidium nitens TaxID=105231 RepID=A0A1Y1HXE7_KLENI|nr:ATP-dependent Clp protease proteolytic subunit [Klebsormidium nitens]|eukprot:GAQ82442.1 ATP-dependent Clp protease proteolytic subunit [Klebsormidium nitens]